MKEKWLTHSFHSAQLFFKEKMVLKLKNRIILGLYEPLLTELTRTYSSGR